jgi:radical SAM-linked protein
MNRYRATFEKGEEVKYLSHLDLTRALPRAFRRAKITLGYSQGFHPMPLIQYGPALGVGTAGENELIDFDSPDHLEEWEFLNRINASLPDGLRFKSLRNLPTGAQSLIKEIDRAEYGITLDAREIKNAMERLCAEREDLTGVAEDEAHRRLCEEFLAQQSCIIERVRKDKRQKVDVRRYTLGLYADTETRALSLVTEISPNGGVKPIEVMAAVYRLTDDEKVSLSSRVRRLRLYKEGQQSNASTFTVEDSGIRAGEKLSFTTQFPAGD